MTSRSEKSKIIDFIICDGLQELEEMDTSDDEEIDEKLQLLTDDLLTTLTYRYGARNPIPRSKDWVVNILPSYDEKRFTSCLRVNRQQFSIILQEIQNDDLFSTALNHQLQFPVHLQLAIVLHRLGGQGDTNLKIAACFGIGDGGTIDKITKRVFTAIMKLEKKYIFWPDAEERRDIGQLTAHELPNCMGYLDGCEIRLSYAPYPNHNAYFSRKSQYSNKIQAICDHKLRLRSVVVGYPGSVHDARIFSESAIGSNPQNFLSDSEWIAADSAYKCTKYVITPYRSNSRAVNSRQRKAFNRYFSCFRVRIEHFFGRLKGKFCSLKEMKIKLNSLQKHKFFCQWIIVCCILYNIVLEASINLDEEIDDSDIDGEAVDEIDSEGVRDDALGEMRRQMIFDTCIRQ